MQNIRINAALLIGTFLLAGIAVPAQSKTSRPRIKSKPAAASKPRSIPPYELSVRVTEGSNLFVSIVSPGVRSLDPLALNALIADLPNGANRFNRANNVFPKVVVEADPNISMLELWNPITLFRPDHTEIVMTIDNGMPSGGEILLAVPWNSPEPEVSIKPNPLLLIASIADDDRLLLNNEPMGTLADTAPLSKRLQEVFRDREANGVLRENTNEIEKSVTIMMPMSNRKVSDLIAIARAIWLPGGDRIALAMDDPVGGFVVDPDGLLDLPPVPQKKKH
jgi:hypothetical protein